MVCVLRSEWRHVLVIFVISTIMAGQPLVGQGLSPLTLSKLYTITPTTHDTRQDSSGRMLVRCSSHYVQEIWNMLFGTRIWITNWCNLLNFPCLSRACNNPRTYISTFFCTENKVSKGHPRTGHEDPERESRYSSTLFLTSALDEVGGQRQAPAVLPLGKISSTHCIGG